MMEVPGNTTFGALEASGYQHRSVKQEMATNLARKLKDKQPVFPGIHGYEDTAIPQIMHAILAGQNIAILGEKGQAKSKIMRSLTTLLDDYLPVLDGTPIPESPFAPVTAAGKQLLADSGPDAPVKWLHREERYGERLAPGSRIADIIGDLDPASVIAGGSLSSETVLHFGLLPRMNLGIFAINELPDLNYLVQVAMFNVLEEADIQIRGFPVRIPLDVFVCFTANPADYTRSGKIITQLKDRIGAEIRTHYPKTRDVGLAITRQEIDNPDIPPEVRVPHFIEQIIEEITVQARVNPMVNQKSGVSARLSIANYETSVASARRRALELGEGKGMVRLTDLGNLFASSSGKIELDPYRDESTTEYQVISKIIDNAIKEVFIEYFSLKGYESNMDSIAQQVFHAGQIEISDGMPLTAYRELLNKVPAFFDLLREQDWDSDDMQLAAGIEFILEGLAATQKLSRRKLGEIISFKSVDVY